MSNQDWNISLLSGLLPSPQVYITCSQVLTLSCITEVVDCDNFWQIESTTVKQNSDREFLQQYLNSNIIVQPDRMHSLKFPLKTNHPPLPTNYTICGRHTKSMANRLAKTPHLLQLYNSIIDEQESRGFIERFSGNTSTSAHSIPHHPVRKESLTTPIRIVCNCSSKQSPSLNDCLNPGPPFLNDSVPFSYAKAFIYTTLRFP